MNHESEKGIIDTVTSLPFLYKVAVVAGAVILTAKAVKSVVEIFE